MKYNDHPLRHELKYLISYADYYSLAPQLNQFMPYDRYCQESGYFIRSLYFDDVYSSAYRDKEAGIARRRKHRIRIYNLSDSVIKFEIKDKFDSYISKTSASITREQLSSIIDGDCDFMLDSDKRALRMGFIDFRTKLLRPKVVVDYLREALVCEEGNVRITFDSQLRAGFGSYDIFDPQMATVPAIESDRLILEVKYDDYLPTYIKKLLAPLDRWQTSQSKFVMCRDAQNTYYRKEPPYGFAL
ncbi:MAG: polyphosphate polymerase domain-containing protein [Clostridia bacterium]|nr:polyphosphate polymerase domain-containing protein [Clostridia bacterium]